MLHSIKILILLIPQNIKKNDKNRDEHCDRGFLPLYLVRIVGL